MKFQLLQGQHIENGRLWSKGQVIESPDNLATVLATKFQRVHRTTPSHPGRLLDMVGAPTPIPKPIAPKTSTESEDDKLIAEANAKAAANRAKRAAVAKNAPSPLLGGQEGDDGVVTFGGDDDEADLPGSPSNPLVPVPIMPPGVEKTKIFPTAAEQDYRVFKNNGQFFLYDGDDLSKPVNAKGLTDKQEVVKLIAKSVAV